MFSKIYNYYQIAKSSLFYTPALICGLYAILCLCLFAVELNYSSGYGHSELIYNGNAEDARSIVKTLLSAMITMTTLVISITMVVLSLSASQLGPRIMKMFMSDPVTKIFIGLFFGSISACFVLTGILHGIEGEDLLPRYTISFVFLLCFSNLFILLAYVHHISNLSIADNIASRVHEELCTNIHRLNRQTDKDAEAEKHIEALIEERAQIIYSGSCGYIQSIAYSRMCKIACSNDFVMKLLCKPGDYVLERTPIAKVYPKEQMNGEVHKEIDDCIVYGSVRTATQDILYAQRHLVEIGLRALSPGINDDYTAIITLNKLASSTAEVFKLGLPRFAHYDDNSDLRVIASSVTESEVVLNAFSQIRDAGQAKPDVLIHIVRLIKTLQELAENKGAKDALAYQLLCVEDHLAAHFKDTKEGERIAAALHG